MPKTASFYLRYRMLITCCFFLSTLWGCSHIRKEQIFLDEAPPSQKVNLVFVLDKKLEGKLVGYRPVGKAGNLQRQKDLSEATVPEMLRLGNREVVNTLQPLLESRGLNITVLNNGLPPRDQPTLVLSPKSYQVRCNVGLECSTRMVMEAKFYKSYDSRLAWAAEYDVDHPANWGKGIFTMQQFYASVVNRLSEMKMIL